MAETREIHKLGRVVTFDDPDGSGARFVAALIPGAFEAGEFIDVMWVDSYGDAFREVDILAGNPKIVA